MSYCRFGEDGSDVYVFTSREGLECCGCILQEREWVPDEAALFGGWLKSVGETVECVFDSNEKMITHLEAHRAAGHIVPDDALERLRDPADAAENERIWGEYRPWELWDRESGNRIGVFKTEAQVLEAVKKERERLGSRADSLIWARPQTEKEPAGP